LDVRCCPSHHILFVEVVLSPPGFRGRELRPHLSRGGVEKTEAMPENILEYFKGFGPEPSFLHKHTTLDDLSWTSGFK
jgi:hypothetical protein